MNNEIKHIGILGMKWGHRKASTNSPSGGKRAGIAVGGDGRKKDKILGKRNRTKIRNFFLGDPKQFIRQLRTYKRYNDHYKKLSKEEKVKTEKRVKTALAVVSISSIASIAAILKYG